MPDLPRSHYRANPRRGNYFALIEQAAAEAMAAAGYTGRALSRKLLLSVVSQHGFSVKYVHDLPTSARSATDLRNRRIYLKQESMGMHTPRTVLQGSALPAFGDHGTGALH